MTIPFEQHVVREQPALPDAKVRQAAVVVEAAETEEIEGRGGER